MLIFKNKNLIIFSTTKAASTAIQLALKRHTDALPNLSNVSKHISPKEFFKKYSLEISESFETRPDTLALIREPIDWLHSWYRYRTRESIEDPKKSTAEIDFNSFVEAYMKPSPPAFAAVGSQARFLDIMRTDQPLTYLWRYDSFPDLKLFLSLRLEKELNFKDFNISPKIPRSLDPLLEQKLKQYFEEDYRLYNAAI